MNNKTRIAILGGGYGGVEAAKILNRRYRRKPEFEITLIDRNPYHTLMTELHEIAGSRVEPEAVQVSFRKIFAGTRVNVVCDEIQGIDFEKQVMRSKIAEYEYDYLIIGTGGAPEFFGIPGVQEHSFSLWSLEDAIRIRTHVEEMFREAAKEPDPEIRKRKLRFVIGGAGFTGVELAGELVERRDTLCVKYHIDPAEVSIKIVEAKDSVLPIFPERPREKTRKYLVKKGVELLLNTPITKAEPDHVVLNGETQLFTETFIWTAGIQGSEFTAKVELTKGRVSRDECSFATEEGIHGMKGCHFDDEDRYVVGQRGRLLVNDYMRSVDHKNVYMVGDVLWYVEGEKVVPQIVETALQTAETAAHNIVADIEGKELKAFKSNYHGNMVSIGGRYGTAHVLGISLSGFLAMGVKHLINVHYLWGLAGLNAVWEYMKGEFFTIKERRSIVGEHFAHKLPTFLISPLRIFLGAKWLNEGIKHVQDGWLDPGRGGLADVDTASIYLPGVSFGDATAAATEWADPEQAVAVAAEYGEPLIEALGIYTWFAESVLSAAPTFAFLLQASVVIFQILIGLALIGGLFTFPAAIVSIGFGLLFIASGWGNPELLWYIGASIVMLGGAGRGLGLDHYVQPWLHRWWNGTRLAKRTFLYTEEPRP